MKKRMLCVYLAALLLVAALPLTASATGETEINEANFLIRFSAVMSAKILI